MDCCLLRELFYLHPTILLDLSWPLRQALRTGPTVVSLCLDSTGSRTCFALVESKTRAHISVALEANRPAGPPAHCKQLF